MTNDEIKNGERTPDAASQSLIEQFLAEGDVVGAESVTETDWHLEELPEGHRSGFVTLVGRPNVGKSTLINALVGQKIAIVSPKPQTTRNRIIGILTQPMHQIIFSDTPGIHQKLGHRLNRLMIKQAIAAIPDADVLLFVVDVSMQPRDEDRFIARLLQKKAGRRPIFFVLNKMDRLPLEGAKKRIESYWALLPQHTDSMPVSALRGTNVQKLLDHILEVMPAGPRYYPGDQITDQTERQVAAELIREAVLRQTYQEVPHATAVLVEELQTRDNGDTYIEARIWVERESQKPIIIGKKGQQLKKIGTAARQELERFIGGKVYLDLWVKVKPKWRDHGARLRELGF